MSQVEFTTLGKSCEFFNGKAHEKSIDENGKYIVVNSKFISSEGKSFKRTNEQMFPLYKADIVMVMSDVPNGKALAKCFIIDKDDTYSLNQRICCIRSKEFDTKYLYYQLNRHEHFLAFNNGENQTNLRKDDILACPLIKPSIDEQRRMVAELDGVLKKIEKAKSNIEINQNNTQELIDGYLQNCFSTTDSNWESKPINKLFEIKPPKSEVKKALGDNEIVSFLPMEDLEVMNFAITATKEKQLGSVINSYTYFAENDVLLAKITPCFENGKIGIARNLKNGIGFGSSEYIVFRSTGVVIPEYLYFFLSRPQFRIEGKKLMTGAVGHKRISKDWIENYALPYPKSISTQTEIVEKLKVLSQESIKLNVLYQKKLETLTDLKDGLLKRAFENELIEAE